MPHKAHCPWGKVEIRLNFFLHFHILHKMYLDLRYHCALYIVCIVDISCDRFTLTNAASWKEIQN